MTEQATFTKLAVLGGAGCGGTTLMLDMLRAHPRVLGVFELGWLLASDLSIDALNTVPVTDGPATHSSFVGFGFDEGEAEVLIAEVIKGGGDWLALYQRLFDRFARIDKVSGRDVFIDKKIEYTSSLLSSVYPKLPGIPAIIVVRDPRAVYCSWRKRPPRNETLEEGIAHYTELMRGAQAALDAGKPVLLVRFEELVLFPEKNMQRVAQFLGLDYDPAMASPVNSYAQHDKTRFNYPPWDIAGREPRSAELDRTAIDEWRTKLKPGVADAIEAALPDDLSWTIYEPGLLTALPSGPGGA
jgi:hypothetical protein